MVSSKEVWKKKSCICIFLFSNMFYTLYPFILSQNCELAQEILDEENVDIKGLGKVSQIISKIL